MSSDAIQDSAHGMFTNTKPDIAMMILTRLKAYVFFFRCFIGTCQVSRTTDHPGNIFFQHIKCLSRCLACSHRLIHTKNRKVFVPSLRKFVAEAKF